MDGCRKISDQRTDGQASKYKPEAFDMKNPEKSCFDVFKKRELELWHMGIIHSEILDRIFGI